jgi:hypothetical protein
MLARTHARKEALTHARNHAHTHARAMYGSAIQASSETVVSSERLEDMTISSTQAHAPRHTHRGTRTEAHALRHMIAHIVATI